MAAALDRLSDLAAWTPAFIDTRPVPAIEWAILERPLTESFFEQSVEAAPRGGPGARVIVKTHAWHASLMTHLDRSAAETTRALRPAVFAAA